MNIIYFSQVKSNIEGQILCAKNHYRSPDLQVVTEESDLLNLILNYDAQSSGNLIEIVVASRYDYEPVRRIWKLISKKLTKHLYLHLDDLIENYSPSHLLIVPDQVSAFDLQNNISALSRQKFLLLLTCMPPLYWSEHLSGLILSNDFSRVVLQSLDYIQIDKLSCIIFNTRPRLNKIPRSFWKRLFVSSLPKVLYFHKVGTLYPLRFVEQQPNTLMIFPERMLPLSRAYYLRAFDLILGLAYGGSATAVLVLGPNNKELNTIQNVLEIFSPEVIVKPLERGRFSLVHKLILLMEKSLRIFQGFYSVAPRRYSERGMIFATKKNAKLLANVIESMPSLQNVIYTGAWFSKAVRFVKQHRFDLRWFCDTHDVFFLLENVDSVEDKHFFYSAARERKRELYDLSIADVVIAISPSDKCALLDSGLNKKLIVESGSFSHVKHENLSLTSQLKEFGFIGSNNRNNQKCIALINKLWWPIILKHWPMARLKIVGAICQSSDVKRLVDSYPDSITTLGFVDSISNFYAATAIILSPIRVQGGLNFKSVEALMSGCFLLTNTMGTRCLAEDQEGIYVVDDDGCNIPDILDSIQRVDNILARRLGIQESANQNYGDNAAYSNLINALNASI
jgi:hypothetical protein